MLQYGAGTPAQHGREQHVSSGDESHAGSAKILSCENLVFRKTALLHSPPDFVTRY
jgi:hypothetical protein